MRILFVISQIFLTATTLYAVDFSGRYETNWGVVELRQNGQKVVGSYAQPVQGDIEGVIEDRVLVYRWMQSDGIWGMGRFKLIENGKMIRGSWGYGKSYDNGGVWEGVR